jgi:hypothetical protein
MGAVLSAGICAGVRALAVLVPPLLVTRTGAAGFAAGCDRGPPSRAAFFLRPVFVKIRMVESRRRCGVLP